MTATAQMQQESLSRAETGNSWSNYPAILAGFEAKGIPADQVTPRVNVFTYNAWKAKGRQVRKGESGVKIVTYVPMTKKDKETGERKEIGRKPRRCTVFHISQTDPIG